MWARGRSGAGEHAFEMRVTVVRGPVAVQSARSGEQVSKLSGLLGLTPSSS